ncbi:hypothetical protein BKA62DRAFT_820141 [Auriculariales sp. MPI-PUGE-AT-0066]|nr:hypothetical protein BKA62DRAFT_820141 [Auriculariales sp. MPI-PUGE-AT-0066]
MSSTAPSILIFGTTGYLGGTILVAVQKAFPAYSISVIVRHDKQDAALKATGVTVVLHGGTENVQELEKTISEFDVVINAADADDLVLVNAIIEGLKVRKEKTGKRAVFFHVSGAYVASDASQGVWDPNFKELSDIDEAALRAVPATAVHRHVENRSAVLVQTLEAIFEADAAKDIEGYQLSPSAVWGKSNGPVRKDGTLVLQTYLSVFGKGVTVGPGSNRMPTVHIDDLADLAVLILKRALSGVDADGSPYAKYYFGESRVEQQKDLAAGCVKALVQLGKLENDQIKTVSVEEASAYFKYAGALATNWVVRADRGRAIGWTPTRLGSFTDEMLELLRPVVNQ